ncbi:TRAP transporter substrate-binding protein [Pseudorhodoferax sp. Leaf265]|uniref:TRAP transporter substrate-binding protein n=1 Tax=Pseudorhodoferax sp. Leaf265 TaxID=1736315 RepID=UPI0006FBA21D|nr:TRAP transporter substrate-binding protein [Pseudorhodoferax sp. Leaf265]KQP20339.1 ABC transporter substrate-binding protein [Pseudorhodoferax sp. Leaf265]PZQ02879.1 MAG: TRAP transporter substrate-binding protein [Variovorax paradoxus]PZQ16791.1 MAG: TRAP transporter substrate-binding protein [Variovorax paradoxus]
MKPLIRCALATAVLALSATAALAQDIQERTIKFGHLNNTDHPVSFGVKRFSELLAAKTGGKFKVQEFPSNQLGNEMQQQSALQGGVQEMSAPATTSLAGIVKEFGLVDFPFAVSTFEQADALLDGPLGQALIAKLPEKGLVALGYWDLGFRNVTNSKRPITKAEDLEGLKLRVIPNPVFLESFKAFKANPVPMPFAELYGALEAKAVDGQENPFAVILSNKFYEVNKFVSATNHVYAANIVLVSKRFWDKLSPAEQKAMNEAANEARGYQRQVSRAAAQKAVGELQAKGMQYNTIAPAEQARMGAVVKPVLEKFAASYDPAIVKLYNDELAKVRK